MRRRIRAKRIGVFLVCEFGDRTCCTEQQADCFRLTLFALDKPNSISRTDSEEVITKGAPGVLILVQQIDRVE